ncbi:MAG: hypothetical protein ACO33A_03815 [Hyphomonas sp.]
MLKLAPFVLAALLAGCGTTSRLSQQLDSTPNSGPCPVAGAVYDAARYVKFATPEGRIYTDIAFTGEVTDVRMYCRYTGDLPLVAEVEIDFAFGRGLQANGRSHDYPYFVAVTRRNGKVLAKEYFSTRAEFNGGDVTGTTERISRITIPRADESISGVNFEIVVGFELTPEQLAFNRTGNRFRLDAVK